MSDLRMPVINKVTLAGNLTREPELRYLAKGTPVCKIGIAVSNKFKTKDGDTREDTIFVNVTIWGSAGEWISENAKKGTPVLVDGRLKMNEWEDKATGQKRSTLEVTAERAQLLAWDNKEAQGGGGNYSGGQGGYQGPPQPKGKYGGYSNSPEPRKIEEPIPEDDIPF